MTEASGRSQQTAPPAGPDVVCTELVRVYATEGIEVQALQGLSLRVDRGELVAIVGASGSGKSTLLSILSGIDQPTAGRAVVAGFDLVGLGRAERTRYQRSAVGFVWQQTARNLIPYLTGAQNISLVLAVAGTRRRRQRVAELLELTGAREQAHQLPAEMSGGQQQRVAIAVALANDPRILLADEPTGELDEESTHLVLSTLRRVNEQTGTTMIIVTHDADVSEHVRRTIRIRDGRIASETLRHQEFGIDGSTATVAQEFVVLDHVGRMQIPPESVRALGLADRVLLHTEADQVVIRPGGVLGPPPPPERVEDRPDLFDEGNRR